MTEAAAMTAYETISVVIAAGNMLAALVAAGGIWYFGAGMKRANDSRAAQAQEQADQAAEERKVTQGMLAALERQGAGAAEDRAAAAEDRKVTQAMLAALTELIRRTAPPQAGPAE